MKEFNGHILSQKDLEDILSLSKPQAWRVYTGKSKLTQANKKIITYYFENKTNKIKEADEAIDLWISKNKSLDERVHVTKLSSGSEVSAKKHFITCPDTVLAINAINKAHRETSNDTVNDILTQAYFDLISDFVVDSISIEI